MGRNENDKESVEGDEKKTLPQGSINKDLREEKRNFLSEDNVGSVSATARRAVDYALVEPPTSSTTGDIDWDAPVEVSTEFMADTIQAAVSLALRPSGIAHNDDEEKTKVDFVVRGPTSAELDPVSANDDPPETDVAPSGTAAASGTQQTVATQRPGAYDRRPGESAERRDTFHPEQYCHGANLAAPDIAPDAAAPSVPVESDERASAVDVENPRTDSGVVLVEAKLVSERLRYSNILEATEVDAIEAPDSDRAPNNKTWRTYLGLEVQAV